jgi:hypothetical protein
MFTYKYKREKPIKPFKKGGGIMKLSKMFAEEIDIELSSNSHLSETEIRNYIRKWPDLIYDILIMMKNNIKMSEYSFHLPDGTGALEFKLDRQSKLLDIKFDIINKYNTQKRFSDLLVKIYEDIEHESRIKYNFLKEGLINRDEVDRLL